jgi:DNA-binding beta-propeller fold protein YncE
MRIYFPLLVLLTSCFTESSNFVTNVTFPYNLTKPDERYVVPDYLNEISGIAFYKGYILCIQDEKGTVYRFDASKKSVTEKYAFGENGDYEDIAVKGNSIFVLKSNGNITKIENPESASRSVTILKTPLSSKNDAEGMAFDSSGNNLLIACKGSPSVKNEENKGNVRSVFSFDPLSMYFNNKAVFRIDLKKKEDFRKQEIYDYMQLLKKKGLTDESNFQPSGISVNPVTGEIFVISAQGKLILILNREGKIADMGYLDPVTFPQPEGICFSPSGDLYISNEGRGGPGTILRFVRIAGK